MAADQSKEIETLVRARYPIVYVVSWEEDRVDACLREVARRRQKRLFQWTTTNGLIEYDARRSREESCEPLNALDDVLSSGESAIFVFKDFHPFLKDSTVVRKLRDLTYALKRSYKTLIILSPILELPPELEKDITVVDYQLPSIEEIGRQLDACVESVADDERVNGALEPDDREQIIKAARGLTAIEVDNVLAKSLVERGGFDVDVILGEKEQIIRKSGILEYFRAEERFADIGGLDALKDWLRKRDRAFTEKARDYGLPQPKGIMLLGVQGCGKSLTAKAVASLYRLPLLRLDVGRVFSGIIGSSEERMRRAIQIADAIAPSVLWIDEIDKGLSGTHSSTFSDAGTTSRVFATFVTWLQEKESAVFVVATANDVANLPPELMRKGRFDEIFFVDLPSEQERAEIFEIHLAKRRRDAGCFDTRQLAARCPGFSGAEIEQAIISAMYDAFAREDEVDTADILRAIGETVPLSVTMQEEIQWLREWAAARTRRSSSALRGGRGDDGEGAADTGGPHERAEAGE